MSSSCADGHRRSRGHLGTPALAGSRRTRSGQSPADVAHIRDACNVPGLCCADGSGCDSTRWRRAPPVRWSVAELRRGRQQHLIVALPVGTSPIGLAGMSDATYHRRVSPNDKPLAWLHGEIKTPPWSAKARILAGHLLRRLRRGADRRPESAQATQRGNRPEGAASRRSLCCGAGASRSSADPGPPLIPRACRSRAGPPAVAPLAETECHGWCGRGRQAISPGAPGLANPR